MVVFLGDHGWQLGDLGELGKKTNFERATRTPLLIRDPARRNFRPGTSEALVEFVDIFPTVIDLALGGGHAPPLCPGDSRAVAYCTEGQSLAPLMQETPQARPWNPNPGPPP